MAGNLREFAMPAAVPAATPAGSKKMPDSQEALYKRMRLEPIAVSFISNSDDINRLNGYLIKYKDSQKRIARTGKEELQIMDFQILHIMGTGEPFDGVYEENDVTKTMKTEVRRYFSQRINRGDTYYDMFREEAEKLHNSNPLADEESYERNLESFKLAQDSFFKLIKKNNLKIIVVENYLEAQESESEASSAQNEPKPVVQTQQPKPTSSTPQQGATTPRATEQRSLLNPQASSSSTPTPAAVATTAPTPPKPEVKHLEVDLDLVLRSGLQPLYSFIGMVGASLGDQDVRSYYKWRGVGASMDDLQSPVAKGAANLEEFVRKNSHLGRPLLRYALKIGMDKVKEGQMLKRIGEQMIPAVIQDERYIMDLLDGSYVNKMPESAEAQWTWGAIDEAVLTYILQDSALGAIHLAHSVIKSIPRCWDFTLKELLMSDGVNAMFAKFVGWEFLQASGGNAYGRSSSSTSRGMVKGSTFMLSAGFATRQALYAQVAVAKIWFEDVRRISNPLRAELDAFIERSRVLLRAYGGAYDRTSTPKLKDNGEDEWGVLATLRELLMNTKGNPAETDYAAYLNLRINLYIAEEKRRYMPPYVLRHCE